MKGDPQTEFLRESLTNWADELYRPRTEDERIFRMGFEAGLEAGRKPIRKITPEEAAGMVMKQMAWQRSRDPEAEGSGESQQAGGERNQTPSEHDQAPGGAVSLLSQAKVQCGPDGQVKPLTVSHLHGVKEGMKPLGRSVAKELSNVVTVLACVAKLRGLFRGDHGASVANGSAPRKDEGGTP